MVYLSTTLSASAVDYDFTYSNLQFVITSSTTAKVVGHVVASPSGNYSIPDYANGYKVTEIGSEAFIRCSKITSMTIGSNVETIGGYAFYDCTGLTSVSLGNVKNIGSAAFCYCSGIKSITLPTTLVNIGWRAFNGTGLTSVTIPSSVQTMGENPFYSCSSLTAINVNSSNAYFSSKDGVLFNKAKTKCLAYPAAKSGTSYTVPSTVTFIAHGAFVYSNLTKVTLPSNLTTIEGFAFAYNSKLTTVISEALNPPTLEADVFYSTLNNSGIKLWVPTPWAVLCYKQANYWKNFPTIIASRHYDFVVNGLVYAKTSATTVEVVASGSEDEAVPGANYSGEISIPGTVTYGGTTYTVKGIGEMAFAGENVTEVTITNNVTYIGKNAFTQSSLRSVTMGNSVTEIGERAFEFCSSLSSVTFGNSLTTIGVAAFCECSELSDVTLPNSLEVIGDEAFSHTGLQSIVIPDKVTYLGWCFSFCPELKSIVIGKGVTEIEDGAFYRTMPTYVECRATTPPTIYSDTFVHYYYDDYTGEYTLDDVTLVVPGGSISAYRSHTYWGEFNNIEAITTFDFYVDGLYYKKTGTNTASVTYRDTGYGSYSASTITIPATVTYSGVTYKVTGIDNNAFQSSPNLTKVTIGSNVKSIGQHAFRYCHKMTSVTIPDNVESIEYNAFGDCNTLSSVVIGKGVTSIGTYGFDSPLTSVTCLAKTPPTIDYTSAFKSSTYSNAILMVPSSSLTAYKNAYGWKNFTNIVGIVTIDEALNVSGGNISFSTSTDYPWTVMSDNGRTYAQSGNAGVHSSSSILTATVSVSKKTTLTFDFKAWGEGSSTMYDQCVFSIDGTNKFVYGAKQNNWETYTVEIPAGTHTLTWSYTKDGSINPTGDYFAVDNVAISSITAGDIDGDGKVNIDDVTALIDMLLSGNTSGNPGADVDGDGKVNIDDLTALIDKLLAGA